MRPLNEMATNSEQSVKLALVNKQILEVKKKIQLSGTLINLTLLQIKEKYKLKQRVNAKRYSKYAKPRENQTQRKLEN